MSVAGHNCCIGSAVAIALLREEYAVVLAGRRADALAETIAQIKTEAVTGTNFDEGLSVLTDISLGDTS